MQPLAWKKKRYLCNHNYKSRARDLDLEHTLDARSSGYHRVQVWSQSNHLSRRSDLCKKFTDKRSVRQTTDAAPLYVLQTGENYLQIIIIIIIILFNTANCQTTYCYNMALISMSMNIVIAEWQTF